MLNTKQPFAVVSFVAGPVKWKGLFGTMRTVSSADALAEPVLDLEKLGLKVDLASMLEVALARIAERRRNRPPSVPLSLNGGPAPHYPRPPRPVIDGDPCSPP